MAQAAQRTPMYRFVMAVCRPIVKTWGRMEVTGLELVPASGPTLLVANHDAYWDPIVIGVAAVRRRQIHALAKSSLWKPGLATVLDGMAQIPIDRGVGDAGALETAIARLRAGACIGVFPEGTRSRGRELRARSGVSRLAAAVPEAQVVGCSVTGTTDVTRFPKRPRITVAFFTPSGGPLGPEEAPQDYAARLLAQARHTAPIVAAGRRAARSSP